MNTLRNELKSHYSQIPNELITDMNLCNGSLRVLLYLFTKPDNWNVYNKDICKRLNISEQTLTKYWKKLLTSGWLKREVSRNKDGKLTGGYTYLIGNFTVSIQSTETVKSIEHSKNKPLKKKETNSDGVIENIYIHYRNLLKSSKSKQSAINNIKKWLKEYSKENLILAIDNYATAKKGSEKNFIKECSNFFGVKGESEGFFIDYINYEQEKRKANHSIKGAEDFII